MSNARSPREVCSTTMGTSTEFCMIFSYLSNDTRSPQGGHHAHKTAHPIGQQKERAVVFGIPSVAAVDYKRIAVPLHDRTLVGRQQRLRLLVTRPVELLFHGHIRP